MNAKEIYLDLLKKYSSDIKNLLGLITQAEPLNSEDIQKARKLFKALKMRLEADYKEGKSVRARSRLSDIDLEYYRPAIEGAYSQIRSKTNSLPDQKWIDELSAALIDIDYYLNQFEKELNS